MLLRRVLGLGRSAQFTTAAGPARVRSSYGLWIDGKEVQAAEGASFKVINPATGAHLSDVQEAREVDVSRAVAAAQRAFDTGVWRNVDPIDRSRIMWYECVCVCVCVCVCACVLLGYRSLPTPTSTPTHIHFIVSTIFD
jgi:hypothetical protein